MWNRFLRPLAFAAILVSLGAVSAQPAASAGPGRFGLVWVHPPVGVASGERMGRAADLGVKWDRFPFYWNEVQPSADNQWIYATYDARVAANQARGLSTQGILLGAPSWATSSGKIDYVKWSEFVRQTVTRYRSTIRYWEVWNEPDLLDGSGKGLFWPYGVPEYATLLRTTNQTIKSVDPSIIVLMGAVAFPYNNEGFLGQLLDELAKDPGASANGYYFDVLPFHSYDRVARMYDVPYGYFGRPSYEGLNAALKRRGLLKPLWVNESGVPVYDFGDGKKAPGRATQSEQAAYVIQSSAYALAAGIERIFYFQLYDDGAGAIDPSTGKPAEYFGLITNGGAIRPAYDAYRTAIRLMDDFRLATRVNTGRSVTDDGVKGIEVITFYGTPNGKVTIAWNADGGSAAALRLKSSASSAAVLDKSGVRRDTITNVDGNINLTLPGATNNNNFDCFTTHGCDPNDYIIGGDPVILIEADSSVPSAAFQPLPTASNSPFEVRWRPTGNVSSPHYDVQVMDSVEGVWRDWLTNTAATSARFGEGTQKLQRGRTYAFRARARDSAGTLLGSDYPPNGMASTLVVGGNVLSSSNIDARIEVVWPHDNQPVNKADQVNISAYLFSRDSAVSVGPNWDTMPRLYRSVNDGVAEQVGIATKRIVTVNGLTVPVFDFNDVDVAAARDPRNRIFFHVGMGTQHTESNTWSHAVDSRTYFPKTDTPTALLTANPAAVDAKIEVVWPHGGATVDKADQANVAAYLFEHGTTKSVPANFAPVVRLYRSIDNGVEQEVAVGQIEMKTEGALKFPTWQFNDVDVSDARDPKHRVYLRLAVDGVTNYSNTWAHAQDARTYFPTPDVPTGVLP